MHAYARQFQVCLLLIVLDSDIAHIPKPDIKVNHDLIEHIN